MHPTQRFILLSHTCRKVISHLQTGSCCLKYTCRGHPHQSTHTERETTHQNKSYRRLSLCPCQSLSAETDPFHLLFSPVFTIMWQRKVFWFCWVFPPHELGHQRGAPKYHPTVNHAATGLVELLRSKQDLNLCSCTPMDLKPLGYPFFSWKKCWPWLQQQVSREHIRGMTSISYRLMPQGPHICKRPAWVFTGGYH